MLTRIIDFSLKNKFIVMLATVALVLGGIYAVKNIPLDAIPDLSDTQVIIYTPWEGQAPNIIEDQVTYPITTKMLSVPRAKVVRGYSFYGYSFVYVIFDDGTDPYWARSRVLEYLSSIGGQLPRGITPTLGPDATGVGWAFMYSINSTNRNLADLRSMQDWYLKYQLTAVPGVSEVASVGGFVKQYQRIRRNCAPTTFLCRTSAKPSNAAMAKLAVAPSSWRKRNSSCASRVTSKISTT
jgi:Cu(I)/Ag(I) efflux system membrane protein CusA/SilA